MANKHKNIDVDKLIELARKYCEVCINNTTEVVASSGKVVKRKDRHIPTIGYFLEHWLRMHHFEFYKRWNWYEARKNDTHPLSHTIKSIDTMFADLAIDIVANEQRGVFYAKNKLGMHDKQHLDANTTVKITFGGGVDKID
jgi:hypothetical protein